MTHLLAHMEGLVDTRRSATGGGLVQFHQAMNWMGTFLLGLIEVIDPLHDLLEVLLANLSRTKRVTKNRGISDEDWTMECWADGDEAKAIRVVVTLANPAAGR